MGFSILICLAELIDGVVQRVSKFSWNGHDFPYKDVFVRGEHGVAVPLGVLLHANTVS